MSVLYLEKRKPEIRVPEVNNAVVLLSGGIDSSTLLFFLKEKIKDIRALTLVYGQKHSREVEAARKVAERASVEQLVVDISTIRPLVSKSALISSEIKVPEVPGDAEHYETLKTTIVPNRNAIFLSLAVAYAITLDYDAVAYAAHWSDRGIYPDCREEFVEAFEEAMQIGTNRRIRILAPFVFMDKAEIVKLGSAIGVPYELTWSCYVGGNVHCGTCSSCRERKRAFQEAGVQDPTVYAR